MYTVADAVTDARVAHERFREHTRLCHYCQRYYPWCRVGQDLESVADAATARWEALR